MNRDGPELIGKRRDIGEPHRAVLRLQRHRGQIRFLVILAPGEIHVDVRVVSVIFHVVWQDARARAGERRGKRLVQGLHRDAVMAKFLAVGDERELRQAFLVRRADVRQPIGARFQLFPHGLRGADELIHLVSAKLQAKFAAARADSAARPGNGRLVFADAHIALRDLGRRKGAHVVGDLPNAAAAVLPILELHADARAIHAAAAAHHRHVILDFGHRADVRLEPPRHRFRPLDPGIRRHLHHHIHPALVRLRHVRRPDDARRNKGNEEQEERRHRHKEFLLMRKRPLQRPFVFPVNRRLDAIDRAPNFPIRDGQPVSEKARGKHRRQREGNEKGKQRRKHNRETELLEKLAREATHEGNRQEHDDVAERDRDGGHPDFRAPFHRSARRILSALQMFVDIFQDDDGIIDQNPDAQRHPHERHHVERKSGDVHCEKRRDERGGNRDDDGRRAPPAAQEEEEHEPRRHEPFGERPQRPRERRPHVFRIVADDDELIIGIIVAQLLQDFLYAVRRGDEIRIAVFINGNPYRVLAIDARIAGHALILPPHLRDRRQRNARPIGGRQRHAANVLGRLILRVETNLRLPPIRVRRARRCQVIFIFHRVDDVPHRDAVIRQFIAIGQDCDFLIAPARELHLRDAARLRQLVFERVLRHRIHRIQRMGAHHGDVHNRRRVHIPFLHDRIVRILRQTAPDRIHLLRRIDGRRVHIRVVRQFEHDKSAPRPGTRIDMPDIGNGRERVLHRFRDLLLDRLGIRAVVAHRHHDERRIHIRIQLDPDAPITVEPQHDEKEHDHRDTDGMRHRITRQIPLTHRSGPCCHPRAAPHSSPQPARLRKRPRRARYPHH